jgi:putative adhesin
MTVTRSSRYALPLAAAAALAMSACAQQPVPAQVRPADATAPQVQADVDGPDPTVTWRPGEPAPTEVRTEQITGPVGRLEVSTEAGRITVHGSDGPGTTVVRSIFSVPVAPEETVRHDGDLLHIESRCPRDDTGATPCRIDYDITLPRATPATLAAASGDVTTTGLTAPLAAKSVSGTVRLDQHRSPRTAVGSTSGDVEVHLLDRPESLSATSVSGDVRVRVPDAGPYRVDADTVSGDTEIGVRSDPGAGSVLELRTTSGDVSVGTG